MKTVDRKLQRLVKGLLCGLLIVFTMVLGGCTMLSEEKVKLRDLDFTILSEEKIPEQLKKEIEERKNESFQLTYTDTDFLYICIGYGKQQTGGYSIAVNELYLTDRNICVSASLLGPEAAKKSDKTPSYPYIVIKTDFLEQTVIFE